MKINAGVTNGIMKIYSLTILLIVILSCRLSAQQQSLNEKKIVSLPSQAEQVDHKIFIQLPKSYGHSKMRYPVIVIFDAHDPTLFDYTSAVVDRLMSTKDIPEAILVGVCQKDRGKELGVERSEITSMKFLQFIKDDLVVYLRSNYNIADYFTFIGHSLGGQFVSDAMMKYPEIFKSVISISGALNYPANNQEYNFYKRKVLTQMEKYVKSKVSIGIPQKYYFSVGDDGMQDSMFRLGALTADSILTSSNPAFLKWHFDEFKGFNHMTTPLVSIPAGLCFIYQDWHFSDSLAMDVLSTQKTDPIDALNKQQLKIKQSYGTDIALPDFLYDQFANFYLDKGNLVKAKYIADQIIISHPNDDAPFALMADILIKQGNKKGAIENLKRAQSNSSIEKYKEKIADLDKP
ncbi:alpha/beta fold hydrolase [Pedobacter cryoconitis]|uniref:Putative alpha/beta superfamily hydrolase n=1 Tax=Pedobacter cryoconitis TaxID=188932 RepID=A0A7X0MIM8_9SPHI|nr:alpha/beta fold hydrolase [Pedobacter cryoconitis]MBB6500567.1 putative alpha/beta superfamily hydrolase [Pedobacter cryoconitis]